MSLEQHYTPAEVATRLRVSVYTVRRWISDGRLRARVLGRLVRVPDSALRAYLEGRTA